MIPTVFRWFPRAVARAAVRILPLALISFLATGCATFDRYAPSWRSFGVYKIDINQGNYLSQDAVDRLKVGMTQAQVRQTLGTPLLTDIFHADRWDYVYWREAQDGKREQRKVALFFEDNKLTRMEGDARLPAVSPAAGR